VKGLGSAALWSLAQSAVRLACGFASIKVTAVILGPAGLALTGQFGNFISLVQGVLGNAVNTALVKLGSEARESEPARLAAIAGTALRLMLVVALAAGVLILLLHRVLAEALLGDAAYWPLMVVVALLLPAVLLGQLHNAWFQLHLRFDLMSKTNIAATLAGALVFVLGCWGFGLWGGLVGTALAYPLTLLAALAWARRAQGELLFAQWRHGRRSMARGMLAFYPMLLVHSAAMPLALLLVRDTLIERFGASQAGLWQASVRLSDMYTMVILAALSMYSLPTLAGARDDGQFREVMVRLVLYCLVLGVCCSFALYLLRDLVTAIVFTREFGPVRELWPWQLVGDVFMLAGWPMRSALTARRRTWAYMAVEAAIGVGLVVLTSALIERTGLAAANIAHAAVWATAFVGLVALHWRTWTGAAAGDRA
jgi:O-antigen/teichoic acid export membrane protein